MLCPVCAVEMVVLEFEQVEIDSCFECHGVWLDSGELELLGERAGVLRKELLGALETEKLQEAQGKRRCPVCRKKLGRMATPGATPIELDSCARGHGMWFDKGELSAVIRTAEADEDNPLVRFFRELEDDTARD